MLDTVKKVLKSHGIITEEDDELFLNVKGELKDDDSRKIIEKCDDAINDFEEKKKKLPQNWIWSVTSENWEILKQKNIWASKIGQKIRDKVRPEDKVIFYVLGTHEFQGIFEFVGEWYDATSPVWSDETDSVIYQSQIKLKTIALGSINVYDIAHELKMFPNPDDKRLINLVLKGGSGYASNNGKPIIYQDYERLLELMNDSDDTSNYYIITQNADSRYDDIPGVQYAYDSDKSHYKNFLVGTNFIVQTKIEKQYYFVGYGKVGKIEKSQGKNPYGNNITKIIAKFSKYTEFNDKKVRTENINEKMLQLAFPNKGARNIPPAMLPITKEIYDEITNTEPILEKLNTFDDEKLPIPTLEDIKEGYAKVSEELLVPEEKIIEIVNALASRRHVLLAGPIGTGKTRLAKIIPEIFWHKIGGYFSEDHTATADWSTQDVIGGIFPKMEDGKPVYDIQNGCVVETVQKNWQYGTEGGKRIGSNFPKKNPPYRGTWLIIDEFNRADIDKAFGQLFTALRTRWLKIPTDVKGISYKNLKIPEDYRIIGTLNTADKHFLFQLSDALKSRFAYIEIDIPKKEQMETEIFYALKNAINDLQLDDYESLVVLDHQNKKVNKEKSNPEFYNRIYQAYNFLDSVRVFKKLGTAILKLIYQTMLVGTKMTGDSKTSLDNALISNLIPQIENLSQASIGTIEALHSDSIVKFFRDAYKNPNRQSYVDAFTKTLEYLESSNAQRLVLEFSNGTLNVDDDGTWQSIQNAYENKKKEFELELNQLKQSMNDLVKSTVI